MLELVLDRIFGVDDALAFLGAAKRIRQAMIGLRADDHIDGGRAAQDFLALGLRDAAGDADHHLATVGCLALLHLAQTAECGIDLFGSLLADMTGIQQDEIGLFHVLGRLIAVTGKRIAHPRGIVDVHLTAVGLDEDLAAVGAIAGAELRSVGRRGVEG